MGGPALRHRPKNGAKTSHFQFLAKFLASKPAFVSGEID